MMTGLLFDMYSKNKFCAVVLGSMRSSCGKFDMA